MPSSVHLQAVNNSAIATFGEKSCTLNIGLRRVFQWVFLIADVPMAIIGADFLQHYALLVDVTNHKLINTTTHLVNAVIRNP